MPDEPDDRQVPVLEYTRLDQSARAPLKLLMASLFCTAASPSLVYWMRYDGIPFGWTAAAASIVLLILAIRRWTYTTAETLLLFLIGGSIALDLLFLSGIRWR